jgi:hypothetical protein
LVQAKGADEEVISGNNMYRLWQGTAKARKVVKNEYIAIASKALES